VRRHYSGWIFQRTKISEEYPPEQYKKDLGAEHEIVLIIRKGVIHFASAEAPVKPDVGDTVLAYIPKPPEAKPDKQKEAKPDKQKEAKAEKGEKPTTDKPKDEEAKE